ncbi:MAG: hypothetical protein ACT4QD_15435 [Acidobacteriota bacterium]
MRTRLAVATVVVGVVCGITASARQGIPRMPDGKPDLQGTWDYATITPIERPESAKGLVMSEAEARRLERGVADRVDRLAQPSDPNRGAPPVGGLVSVRTGETGVGGYNNFYIDSGRVVARVDGTYRTSLIIDPADGRLPPLTAEARARAMARAAARKGREFDHPEYRPQAERCLLSFGTTTPLLPNYFYNNNIQIVQTPDHVMIVLEMVHDVRIVRMKGDASTGSASARAMSRAEHPPAGVRFWMGDSIGWWEGDTLVVDTTNFAPQQMVRGQSAEHLHVVERFRRVDAETMVMRFTVDDPATYTRPWTGEVPFRASGERIYEYACHEGNYALENILRGERRRDEARAAAKRPQ